MATIACTSLTEPCISNFVSMFGLGPWKHKDNNSIIKPKLKIRRIMFNCSFISKRFIKILIQKYIFQHSKFESNGVFWMHENYHRFQGAKVKPYRTEYIVMQIRVIAPRTYALPNKNRGLLWIWIAKNTVIMGWGGGALAFVSFWRIFGCRW